MMRRLPILLLVAALGAACSRPSPEQQVVADAAEAMGGSTQILAVTTLEFSAEGTQWNMGQDMTIEADGQTFEIGPYNRHIDLENARMRTEWSRTPRFTYFRGPAAQTQMTGVDGDVAYARGAGGDVSRTSDRAAADLKADRLHHPLVIVRAGLSADAALSNAREEGGARLVDIEVEGRTYTLAIDAETNLPLHVSSPSHHDNLGDVVVRTTFEEYGAVDGLRLPAKLTTTVDRFKTLELRLSSQSVAGDAADLIAPEPARAAAPPAGPPAPNVTAEPVGEGVWLLAGQGHHSALVEFEDSLMLIEAPASEARTLAVIAKARETVPGKPITHLVSTHHHFDHSAGIRGAMAEGLTIVTHEDNVEYYEEAGRRPWTRQPDTLAKSPRDVTVEGVGDSRVIEDGTQRVELYHLSGNPHGDTILMAYLPKQRVVIQADAFSTGGSYHPYAANLLEHIRERKLQVDRVVPLHGQIVPLSELEKAAASGS